MAEPTYGVVPLEQARSMSGLALLRGWSEGRFPAPPIGQTLGFALVEVEEGRVVFLGTPEARHYNPLGTVHGGFAATLLDSAMGCAVHSTLKPGIGYTSVELKVNFVRPMTDKTGPVRCEGKIVHVGARIGTAEGRIVDAQGKLLAHGSTTCLIFPV